MGKSAKATPFVSHFYGSIYTVPYDIIFVCVNLLANSLEDFVEAKKILTTVLLNNKNDSSCTNSQPPSPCTCTPFTHEQREILFEFLLFHVLVPLHQIADARALLAADKHLSSSRKQGWDDYLQGLDQVISEKHQQQQQQQQQLQSQNHVNTADKTEQTSLTRKINSLNSYYNALTTRSRQVAGGIWGTLCKFASSKFGFMAFGIAVFMAAIFLFSVFRRRRRARINDASQQPASQLSPPSSAASSTFTTSSSSIRNAAPRSVSTTSSTSSSSLSSPNKSASNNSSNSISKLIKQKSVMQSQFRTVGPLSGGFWSSVSELLTGAFSLK
jgi:hypothetical protein